jgi:hypothetical protein
MSNNLVPQAPGGRVAIVKTPRTRAIEMRREGTSLDRIAQVLDLPFNVVDQYIGDYMLSDEATPEEVAREEELSRLEEMDDALRGIQNTTYYEVYQGVLTDAVTPAHNLSAIDKRIKLADRRSKLSSLDRQKAPERPVDVPETITDAGVRDAMRDVLREAGINLKIRDDEPIDVQPVERVHVPRTGEEYEQ